MWKDDVELERATRGAALREDSWSRARQREQIVTDIVPDAPAVQAVRVTMRSLMEMDWKLVNRSIPFPIISANPRAAAGKKVVELDFEFPNICSTPLAPALRPLLGPEQRLF